MRLSHPRLSLAHLPTPVVYAARISRRLGVELFVKRDDATGGPEAGNKIRKLEYLLAHAQAEHADTIITCGGVQSNHARATAICARSLGMRSVLLLRDPALKDDRGVGVSPTTPLTGNLLLGRMVGADVRLITASSYRDRAAWMARIADEERVAGHRPHVIGEGGSNGLGSLGYVDAMAEVEGHFDKIIVACGSGGTAAGIALGAAHHGVADEVVAVAVCNDERYFEQRIREIVDEARALEPALPPPVPYRIEDRFKGPGYGISTPAQRASIAGAAAEEALILDPVYSGKAFYAVEQLAAELQGQRLLFVHTGGLPGLLADPGAMADVLGQ